MFGPTTTQAVDLALLPVDFCFSSLRVTGHGEDEGLLIATCNFHLFGDQGVASRNPRIGTAARAE